MNFIKRATTFLLMFLLTFASFGIMGFSNANAENNIPVRIDDSVISGMKVWHIPSGTAAPGTLIYDDVSGGQVSVPTLKLGDKVTTEYYFAIPNNHSYKAGDYVQTDFPKGLGILGNVTQDLYSDGVKIATLNINAQDKYARVTFNNQIEMLEDIGGSFFVTMNVDNMQDIREGGLKFPFKESDSITILIQEDQFDISASKSGFVNIDGKPTWVINVNSMKKTIEDLVIVDTRQGNPVTEGAKNWWFSPTSNGVTVYDLTKSYQLIKGVDFKVTYYNNAGGVISSGVSNKVKIELIGNYKTTKSELNVGIAGESDVAIKTDSFNNSATIDGNRAKTKTVTATVSKEGFIKKSGALNATTKKINWKIIVNPKGNSTIPAGTKVEDSLVYTGNDGLNSGWIDLHLLDINSVKIYKTSTPGTLLVKDVDYKVTVEPNGQKMTVEFLKAFIDEYTISYDSNANPNPTLPAANDGIWGTEVVNVATSNGTTTSAGVVIISGNKWLAFENATASTSNPPVVNSTPVGTMEQTWEMEFNKNNLHIPNFVVYDYFIANNSTDPLLQGQIGGLKLKSVAVSARLPGQTTFATLVENIDYKLTVASKADPIFYSYLNGNKYGGKYDSGYKIELLGTAKTTYEYAHFKFSVETEIDKDFLLNYVNPGAPNAAYTEQHNMVHFTFGQNGHYIDSAKIYLHENISNNLAKSGKVKENRDIHWNIFANTLHATLPIGTEIEDLIRFDQEFVPGSLKVYELKEDYHYLQTKTNWTWNFT
ncbi:MAG: Ig-like domain-containing protein, partial [Anaerovoracaceae bacterium]